MDGNEIRTELADARTQRERLFGELENLRAREQVDGASDGLAERIGNINRGIERADDRIAELEAELGRFHELRALAADPRHREDGTPPAQDRYVHRGERNEHREAALRTIERHAAMMDDEAAERTDRLVRRDDPRKLTARYLSAVGDEHYRSAFGKLLADPVTGHNRFTTEEIAAVQRASAVQAERAMSIGSDSAGGYALPFTLDPSIMLSSAGALNPVRRIARVETTTTNEWRGVSSDGVSVSYVAEASTASDGSPTLAQPVVTCAQWRAFVPFSIELGQDFMTLEAELVRLVADGRDTNDSTMFYSGSGTAQPRGVMTDLTSSQRVATSGATAFVVDDPWLLSAAISARFRATTTYAAHPSTWDTAFRFVGTNSTEPEQFSGGRGGDFLGRPKVEWSAVGTQWTTTSGTIMVAGDFSNYLIADRLGITAELIPHLFSGNTAGGIGWPTGQRGLYVYGRTGAAVTVANAFRALVVS